MRRSQLAPAIAFSLLTAAVTACAPNPSADPPSAPTPPTAASPAASEPGSATPTPVEAPTQVEGTVVRFTSERTTVEVTIGEDSPGVRDFLSLLPTELVVEELAGAEKIAYLPRELDYEGSPGSDPEDGDLIYYTPWGNLGFYYDATGIGYSDATLLIGTYRATEQQLALLEGGTVTVEIVD